MYTVKDCLQVTLDRACFFLNVFFGVFVSALIVLKVFYPNKYNDTKPKRLSWPLLDIRLLILKLIFPFTKKVLFTIDIEVILLVCLS